MKSSNHYRFYQPPRLVPALIAITLITGSFLILVAGFATWVDIVAWR